MRKTFAGALAGAVVASVALFSAPQPAQAQVGVSIGIGSGFGTGWDDDWGFGYNPGFIGFGYTSPVAYYGGYAPAYGYYGPRSYAPPVYRVVRRPVGPVVVRRAVYPYARPVYYAPRPVVRTTRIVTVPRYVTRTRIVTVPRR